MLNTVKEINFAALAPTDLVSRAEEDYHAEIHTVAQKISDDDDIKIVALAGPSASGKTTSAHILCDRLNSLGEKAQVVSLDDFYLSPEKLPLDENGKPDLETVEALDISMINRCLNEIVKTGKTVLPRYDFIAKRQILDSTPVDVSDGGIILVEGLHALNTIISDLVPRKNIFKIYISVNCSIEDDFGEQLLSSRQVRLVRRVLRDRIFRGTSVNETLALWNSVVAGERKFLYPYKNTADYQLRTLHIYEPCIYRDEFLQTADELAPDAVCRDYYLRTLAALKKFVPMEMSYVPDDSLIREFIGNNR